MLIRWLLIPFAVLAASLAFVACGGDDDDSGDDAPAATAAPNGDGDDDSGDEGADGDSNDAGDGDDADDGDVAGDDGDAGDGAGDGAGKATLSIGSESWELDVVTCALSPEETESARMSLLVTAFGETAQGDRIRMIASIQDPEEQGRYEGEDIVKSIELKDIDNAQDPSLHWQSIEVPDRGIETVFQIGGDGVSAEAGFDDRTSDAIEGISGTLSATCA